MITSLLKNHPYDLDKFATVIGSIQEQILDKMDDKSLYSLFVHNQEIRSNPTLSSRMYALCTRICDLGQANQQLAPVRAANSVAGQNKLGPIVFASPELGRWSTAGGLGVMVDELSQGLAALGQQVFDNIALLRPQSEG